MLSRVGKGREGTEAISHRVAGEGSSELGGELEAGERRLCPSTPGRGNTRARPLYLTGSQESKETRVTHRTV